MSPFDPRRKPGFREDGRYLRPLHHTLLPLRVSETYVSVKSVDHHVLSYRGREVEVKGVGILPLLIPWTIE